MMANKQLRKMIICEIFRFFLYFLLNCLHWYIIKEFDYCSVHVSTVISHVSQQFRFLVFFIVTIRMNFMHFVVAMGCVSAVELFL
ncbi:conserved hypothetical protein [Trichinella spiralis]|uniref:hypothetical protein n=1 Tax=Trichinella spiralis TaxID=6334 RepID=UPI0001EFBE1C|nr:conserved hypothetical protein [Trichinella spiralis]